MRAAEVDNTPGGKGIFYWEPDWIPVEGAGWKAGEGNEWENLAMFDFQGNALESLDVFKMVSDQSLPTQQYKVKTIEAVLAKGDRGELIPVKDGVKVIHIKRKEVKSEQ